MIKPPDKILPSQFTTEELTEIYGPPGVVSRELLIWANEQFPRVFMNDPFRFRELFDETVHQGEWLFPECNWVLLAVQHPQHLARRFNIDLPKASWEDALDRCGERLKSKPIEAGEPT